MKIDAKKCAELLMQQDNIKILCHRDPDGDTFGSSMALYSALTAMGKRATVECSSEFPASISFLKKDMPEAFEPDYIVAVDIAAPKMILDPPEARPHVDLCIDHHGTNPLYADHTYLVEYGSAGEAMFDVLTEMGAEITPYIATALFTAMTSDTGGFRYSTSRSKPPSLDPSLLSSFSRRSS